jgi:hypothetical protein
MCSKSKHIFYKVVDRGCQCGIIRHGGTVMHKHDKTRDIVFGLILMAVIFLSGLDLEVFL